MIISCASPSFIAYSKHQKEGGIMKKANSGRVRDTVYVIGAGFSAGLGYPLTKSLLIDVWPRLEPSSQKQLSKIIRFHHPAFKVKKNTTFPDIEQFLTEVSVNLELFDASRPAEGTFTRKQLEATRQELLSSVARWFHDLYEDASSTSWLADVVQQFRTENAAIVSFNWDLVLDQLLFESELDAASYGLSNELASGPVLLKPHGSLNWYEASQIRKVAEEKHTVIFEHSKDAERIEAFLHPREIKSKAGHRYTPLIVPPTYLKDFNRPVFHRLWNHCTDVLSTPKKIIFLGYSLPAADLHAQFIFRCGFHNQVEGRLRNDGSRHPATGPAEVIVVNPHQEAARRIEAVAGPRIPFTWVPKRIEDWLKSGS
jgi:hypothetical protein